MYFEESDLPQKLVRRKTIVRELMGEFLESGFESAELFNEGDYHNNNDMRNSFAVIAKKGNLPVKVLMINGRVFLLRKRNEQIS